MNMGKVFIIFCVLCVALAYGAPQRSNNPNASAKPQSSQQQPSRQQQAQQVRPQVQQPPRGPSGQPPPQQQQPPPQGPGFQGPPPDGPPGSASPQINWGQCPQLEPTMDEKIKKAGVITRCLEVTPIPNNITRESVELHREQVAACALQVEGWFNEQGLYRFDKAETEIRSKKLKKDIEDKVLLYHKQCKEEAEDKYPVSSKNLIAQIQLYQACMDYFISEVCGIEVGVPQEFGSSPQFQ